MEVIYNFENIHNFAGSAVTVGTFDGLHCGHYEIIRKLKMAANDLGLSSVVITFFPHPRTIVSNDADIRLLTPLEEKKKLFEKLEIDYLYIIKFSKEFSKKTYKEFFNEILVGAANAKHLVIGYDHKFGKGRDGNINKLVEYTKSKKIGMSIVGPKEIDNQTVSSTKIRNALLEGNITFVNKMLGRYYTVEGLVVEGTKRGRTLGFPTANLEIVEKIKLIPKNGVYFVKVSLKNVECFGVANIGLRPTFNHAVVPITEVYIIDFDQNIYGESINIFFIDRIRDEIKFSSKGELEEQIKNDVQKVRRLIKELNN